MGERRNLVGAPPIARERGALFAPDDQNELMKPVERGTHARNFAQRRLTRAARQSRWGSIRKRTSLILASPLIRRLFAR